MDSAMTFGAFNRTSDRIHADVDLLRARDGYALSHIEIEIEIYAYLSAMVLV